MEDGQINDGQVVCEGEAFYLRSLLAKNLDDVQVIVTDGIDNARVSNLVEVVHLNAMLDQKPDHFDFSEPAWIVKQGLSRVKLVDRVRELSQDGLDFRVISLDHLGVEGVSINCCCALGML